VPPEESASLFARAGEPKKLVTSRGFGYYEVYVGLRSSRSLRDHAAI
jgi:hypothetical protein